MCNVEGNVASGILHPLWIDSRAPENGCWIDAKSSQQVGDDHQRLDTYVL